MSIESYRRVGIEVWPKGYKRPVRPIFRVVEIIIPDGEIDAEAWDTMTRSNRDVVLGEKERIEL